MVAGAVEAALRTANAMAGHTPLAALLVTPGEPDEPEEDETITTLRSGATFTPNLS